MSAAEDLRSPPDGDGIRRFARIEARFENRSWPWAEENGQAIAAHWARRTAERPRMFNGRVLLIADSAAEGEVFRATYFETDYANLVFWLDNGCPDRSIANGFAMGAPQGADDGYLLGVMGPHTATAGKVYFPAGTPDPSDRRPDGTVDLSRSVHREMEEETGLTPADYETADHWIAVRSGGLVAFMRPLRFAEPAEAVRTRIRAFLGREAEPELSDIRIVRSLADLDPSAMPAYLQAFMRWAYRDGARRA